MSIGASKIVFLHLHLTYLTFVYTHCWHCVASTSFNVWCVGALDAS